MSKTIKIELEEINEKLARNGGKWDLTNDNGELLVYDSEKDIPIPDLQ